MASFQTLVSKKGNLVYLVTGKDRRGFPTWHYLLVDKVKHALFEKALESGNITVDEYGQVLRSGLGDAPPEAVREEIEAQYG